MKISASEQVQRWLLGVSPDAKKRVRASLRALENGRGDLKMLHSELEGLCRLRVGGLRIIYSQSAGSATRLEYADRRDIVYETFLKILNAKKS